MHCAGGGGGQNWTPASSTPPSLRDPGYPPSTPPSPSPPSFPPHLLTQNILEGVQYAGPDQHHFDEFEEKNPSYEKMLREIYKKIM